MVKFFTDLLLLFVDFDMYFIKDTIISTDNFITQPNMLYSLLDFFKCHHLRIFY